MEPVSQDSALQGCVLADRFHIRQLEGHCSPRSLSGFANGFLLLCITMPMMVGDVSISHTADASKGVQLQNRKCSGVPVTSNKNGHGPGV